MILVRKRCCDASCISCALKGLLQCEGLNDVGREPWMELEYLSFVYTCPKLHKGQKQGLFSVSLFLLTQT